MADSVDPYLTPEGRARHDIDRMLDAAGWLAQDRAAMNLFAARGVAVREFLLEGNQEADYLLFVDRRVVSQFGELPQDEQHHNHYSEAKRAERYLQPHGAPELWPGLAERSPPPASGRHTAVRSHSSNTSTR